MRIRIHSPDKNFKKCLLMYNMRQFFFALTLACRLLYIIFRFYKPLLPCTTVYSMIALFASKSWPISRKKEKKSYFVHFRNSNVWQMVWKTVSYNVWSKFILRIPEVNCLADVAEPNLVGTCSGLLKISRLELVNFFFFSLFVSEATITAPPLWSVAGLLSRFGKWFACELKTFRSWRIPNMIFARVKPTIGYQISLRIRVTWKLRMRTCKFTNHLLSATTLAP